jgi:hypothetical protein
MAIDLEDGLLEADVRMGRDVQTSVNVRARLANAGQRTNSRYGMPLA